MLCVVCDADRSVIAEKVRILYANVGGTTVIDIIVPDFIGGVFLCHKISVITGKEGIINEGKTQSD